MNILLNTYCNLSCSYCFAKQILNEPLIPNDMSLKDFKLCLDFLRRSKIRQVRLLGGEPTISKNFKQYCELILNNKKHINEVLLYSNGLILPSSMDSILELNKNIHTKLLINTNSPTIIGAKYNILLSNIEKLLANKINIYLGVNIDSGDFDYRYIFNLLDKYKLQMVRWVLVAPNVKNIGRNGLLEYYKKHIDVVLNFLEECFWRNIKTRTDCNVIPLCAFNDSQLRKMVMYDPVFLLKKRCEPVIDVLPDLSVVRCFGTSAYMICNLRDFNDRNELAKYFINNIDNKVSGKLFTINCKNCSLHSKDYCSGGCLAFTLSSKN